MVPMDDPGRDAALHKIVVLSEGKETENKLGLAPTPIKFFRVLSVAKLDIFFSFYVSLTLFILKLRQC